MKIKQISVSGLFGIFDHVIPLNSNDKITIIHGPNGFGKTAILRLLNGFFNSRYSAFKNIPFNIFRIEFDNNNYIELRRLFDIKDKAENTNKNDISCDFYKSNSEKKTFLINSQKSSGNKTEELYKEELTKIARLLSKKTEKKSSEEENLQEEPGWLRELKNSVHIYLIESQRLLNSVSKLNILDYETSSMLPAVSTYSDELAQLMRDKFTEYGTTAQSLDRTFPTRLVKQQPSPNLTDEQLRKELDDLESTRSRLMEVGLLDKNENSDFQIQPQSIMDESMRNILSVYVEDVEKKLSVFGEIASKIELLRRIINDKFSYSYKEINFNKEKGFVFKTLYNSSSSGSENLSPIDLSSGEQHELVLLYELLFKVQPNSLVLIDEPELSLHVGWQTQFLKDLQEITKLTDLDILMATHSPDIIQERWDLTVELKGPVK